MNLTGLQRRLERFSKTFTVAAFGTALVLSQFSIVADATDMAEDSGPAPIDAPSETVAERPSESIASSVEQHSSTETPRNAPVAEAPSPSLDELLRQAKQGNVSAHETAMRELAEREAMGQALKNTLLVADEIAAYGDAGVRLLNDASLEQVVEALVKERRRRHAELTRPAAPQSQRASRQAAALADDESASGFDAYELTYILRLPEPVRVGLRRADTGEVVEVRAGRSTRLDGDAVRLLSVAARNGTHEVVFEVNGEERRAILH